MDRLARLRSFAEPSSDIDTGLRRAAETLCSGPLSGHLAIVITEHDTRVLRIDLSKPDVEKWTESHQAESAPDLVVLAKRDALAAILRGELSPLEALFRGALRYAGDEQLGVQILRELSTSQDAVFEPCREDGW